MLHLMPIKLGVELKRCSRIVKVVAIMREDCKASLERLNRIVLLRAIAYTHMGLAGQNVKRQGQQKYVNRLRERQRIELRHSNFWVGLYGKTWVAGLEFCEDWVQELMKIRRNKLPFFHKGLRAMSLIQQAF